jgi:ribonuclease R
MTRSDIPSLERIREALVASDRGPLRPKDLARALDVPQPLYRDLKSALRGYEASGELYRVRGNRYAVPEKINLTVGTLRVLASGNGFVRPEAGGEEIFVSAAHQDSAMDGDRVAVRIESRSRGKGPSGRILRILERARTSIVGTFKANRRFGFVAPLDRRLSRDILIPEGNLGEANDGDVVVVRIVQYGTSKLNSIGEVERVLGEMQDPGVDVLAILHAHGLPAEFPQDVEEAAVAAASRMDHPGERTDRRNLHVVAVDPADAKDHDDALSITPLGKGVWEVGIHIADVAHFVEEGSALDLEAMGRGTSVYLVDQVVPMLPHTLSSDLCSLREGEDRLAFSLFVTLDGQGRVQDFRFEKTWIRCRVSLDYDRAQAILEGEGSADPETDEALRQLDRLARVLRERRSERGSLDFDLPEARVVLDDEGMPQDIRKVEQLASHRLIEDFMLLANEVVATTAVKKRLPIPFRVHEPPSADRMQELREFLASVGHSLPAGDISGKTLQKVLERVSGRPEEVLVSRVILRSMSRARYQPSNLGHFGLASKAYAHFTSPIRRYPDLIVHRVMAQALVFEAEIPEGWSGTWLEEVATLSSERERVAQKAERDSVEMKKIEFMRRHLGDEFEGTIAAVTAFGFFVLLDRYFVEGLVHVSTLGDDYYHFIEEAYALVGDKRKKRFRLGDRVEVRVVRADKEERKVDFELLQHRPRG